MLRFALKKIAYVVPTFFGITLVAFFFIRLLPGDPILVMAGERGISPERRAEIMAQLGFDQPLWKQYLDYVGGIFHGDFGISFMTKQPVITEFLDRFTATLELALCAIIIAAVIGIIAGVIAAVKRGSWFDQGFMGIALVGYSMPIFWWGLMMIVVFSVQLGWTPVGGRIGVRYFFPSETGFMLIDSWMSGEKGAFSSAVSHLILPSIVLATVPLAVIARQTRSAMLEVLSEDYMRTAKAKGLSSFRIVGIHALRNGLIPVITTLGLQVGLLMGGAVLTESVFSWPGIGTWLLDAIASRDYTAVQCGILIIALLIMLVNLIVDLLYGLINPRIRH